MRITDEGNKLVQSLEFAQELRTFLADLHKEGCPEEQGDAYALSLIAWAACGHDVRRPPNGQEIIDLSNFIESNVSAVNALADKCLENLVKVDTGDIIH
jgi:hypothetical protein